MITKLTPIIELQELYNEMLMNHTNKVSKVSKGSVVNAHGLGVAKIAQKAIKDVALIEANLFPKESFGEHLDQIAVNWGIAPRYGALGSSTYILIVGEIGTVYEKDTNTFTGSHGIEFELSEDTVTIPDSGYIYANVVSKTLGSNTKVEPLTISICNSAPVGHVYVINEYRSIGGRDVEDDKTFRNRIMKGANLAATGTLGMLTQVFIAINYNVLRLFNYGLDVDNRLVIGVLSQNGADFSPSEFAELLEASEEYLNLVDIRRYGTTEFRLKLVNIDWEFIDVDYRVDISDAFDRDDVRINTQIQMTKYLDFRYWNPTNRVEWDDLLAIAKGVNGVKYVPDNYFFPNVDKIIERNKLPRIRGFIMRNLSGYIYSDSGGNLSPVYFPNDPNEDYASTIINRATAGTVVVGSGSSNPAQPPANLTQV